MTASSIQNTANHYISWLSWAAKFLPVIVITITAVIVLVLVTRLLLRLWNWRTILRQEHVFIEVTPPATSTKTPLATQELYAVLHGIGARRTLKDRLLYGNMTFSCELPSNKKQGVRYLFRASAQEATAVQKSINSFLPTAKTRIVGDFLPEQRSQRWVQIVEFKQQKPYPFPLKDQFSFADHDLSTYLTNAMTGLQDDEFMAFQVVATPVVIRDAQVVVDKLLRNEDLLAHLSRSGNAVGLQRATSGFFFFLSSIVGFITDMIYSGSQQTTTTAESDQRNQREIAMRNKPARSISSLEQALHDAMYGKVKQPKYRVELRAIVAVNDKQELKRRIKGLGATLSSLDTEYQSLRLRYNFPYILRGKYRLFTFTHRLPSLIHHHSAVLAASEIASVYHFPASASATTDLAASYNRTLGATPSLRQTEQFDVIIGENVHHSEVTPIGLSAEDEKRHMYIIGATGMGKTTFAENLIIQHIQKGDGVGFIDPHGDSAKKILRYIPEERIKDVVYFHPDDIDFPIGLNMLEIDPAIQGSERVKLEIKIVNMVVEVLRKSFSEDASGGHRIEAMLRNGLQTTMTVEGATLFTISKLIRNAAFRKSVVNKLEDERLLEFWNEEFAKAGDMQRVSMTKGVTLKLDRYESDPAVGRILGQQKSTINFSDIIDNKKILICDLSKGEIGSDNASLIGALILTFLQVAAEQRARIEESERIPFHLYVDEFQNFATRSFTEMASEARKYGLFLTIAEQTTSQFEDKELLGQLLANVGTIVTFRTGNPADEKMLLPFFGQFLSPGEINNLPAYNFYARISSQKSQPPVSGQTILLEGDGSKDIAKRVIEASRQAYGHKYVPTKPHKASGTAKSTKSDKITNPTREVR